MAIERLARTDDGFLRGFPLVAVAPDPLGARLDAHRRGPQSRILHHAHTILVDHERIREHHERQADLLLVTDAELLEPRTRRSEDVVTESERPQTRPLQ